MDIIYSPEGHLIMKGRMPYPDLPDRPAPIELGADHYHYYIDVLRLTTGCEITLFDSAGREAVCRIVRISPKRLDVEILRLSKVNREASRSITLAFALPKGEKPDLVLQKATELGVSRFVIFLAERSVSRPAADRLTKKIERWEKIVTFAVTQCGRTSLPRIVFHENLQSALVELDSELKLLFKPGAASLKKYLVDPPPSVSLLIGPEGGLTDQEMEMATDNGFMSVSFGKRILRAETAAIAAVVPFALDDEPL